MRSLTTLDRSFRVLLCASLVALGSTVAPLDAQTPAPAPAPRRPAAPAKPRAPQAPAPKPAAKPAEPAKPPAPPPPQDVRFKTNYTTGDQKTETVTMVKGERERFEFQDMVLLKQHDQKRIIQISRTANTYLVVPEGMPSMPTAPQAPAPATGAIPKPPGVVMVATTIVDTGERKMAFGYQARHVKSMIDKQPMPGACDTAKQRVETDGWYIDLPKTLEGVAPQAPPAVTAGACADQIQATSNGDPKALGFPIGYTTTILGDDGKPLSVSMDVSEFEMTTLDPALFEIPQNLNAALNIGELGRALSNANEAKLAAENAAPPVAAPVARTPGVIRIGVPELINKTKEQVDTRALRGRIVSDLTDAKFEVTPLAAAAQPDLQKRATERELDYILLAEVTELKVSKGGGLGGVLKAASKVAAPTAAAGPEKPATEASVAVKLIQPDGKQRLSTTTKGKDGGGFNKQAAFGIGRLAGGLAMSMMMGPQMMSRMYNFSYLTGTNLGGMGLLGSPDLYRMQSMGMMGANMGRGMGIDQTAGAASYMVQQAVAMNSAANASPAGGPSFEESLAEALDNASKAVTKALVEKK